MNLRPCLLYPGIRTSRKMARLSWMQRDFFYGLLNAADPKGRFEQDAELLRPALYAPLLSKVSERDVQGALLACQQAGLVKLWTGDDGRGYGEVVNYRQHGLKSRKSDLPAPPGAKPEPELFGDPPTDEGRKEEKPPKPPAEAGGGNASPLSSRAPRRGRSPERRLGNLRDELDAVEHALNELLYPGGSAFKIVPTGEKRVTYDKLMARRETLKQQIEEARKELE